MNLSNTNHKQHYHFIGICGSGMSGIAEILANSGCMVSGSDLSNSAVADRLRQQGIQVYQGHAASHIQGSPTVVLSSAIDDHNPELMAAKALNLSIVPRAQMIAELMHQRFGIAVAGTHGKTTTTSLLATVLAEADLDPTYIIGGILNSAKTNAKLGSGHYLIAEADESDASFLRLSPKISIVTNVDADHTWFYDHSFEKIRTTFIEFLQRLPEEGLAVLCYDDLELRQLLPRVDRPYITYGFDPAADVQASNFRQERLKCYFTVKYKDEAPVAMELNMPGQHNVLNALAVITVARYLGVSFDQIRRGLAKFQGVGRRFQIRGDVAFKQGTLTIVDDYGHHPREIKVTLEAARRAWPDRRIVLAFQPHRYSRTQAVFSDFIDVLTCTDVLVLFDIYSAGESPIPGCTGQDLYEALLQARPDLICKFIPAGQNFMKPLEQLLQPGDILMMQGAGDITAHAATVLKHFGMQTETVVS